MKKKKIIITVLAVLLAVMIIAGGVFGVACAVLGTDMVFAGFKNLFASPANNIKAAWLFLTSDSQKIEQQIDETKKQFDDAVKDATGTELSDEVKAALDSGRYTEEEMALIVSGVSTEEIERMREEALDVEKEQEIPEEKVLEENTSDVSAETEKDIKNESDVEINHEETVVPPTPDVPEVEPPVEKTETPSTEVKPVQVDDTAATIAKMYVIKNKFMKKLESIEIDIINEYENLPKEQRVPQSRKSIAGKYISTVADLEIQCDAEVEAVLSELKTKLSSLGKDLSVIDTIRKAYQNEKSLKKAYYMDIYLNGVHGKNLPILQHPDVVNK